MFLYAFAFNLVVFLPRAALADDDVPFKRNACFTIGVLFLKGGEASHPYYADALKLLLPIVKIDFSSPEAKKMAEAARMISDDERAVEGLRDNAASAIGKMILIGPHKLDLKAVRRSANQRWSDAIFSRCL